MCNAGGGFAYVGAMHDSFPHALTLSRMGCNAFALCAFTEPAFAKSFLEALGDETHADILAQLTVQTQRVQKRRQEAQAHRKNVKMGKK